MSGNTVSKIKQLLKVIKRKFISMTKKPEKFKNFYKLYGFDGVKNTFRKKLGHYHYPHEIPSEVGNVPIFIISYNRLDCLKKLIEFLTCRGLMDRVIILDNKSSYPPLIEYLDSLSCKVVKLKKNYGHLALWKCHLFDDIILKQSFILTDSDVVPLDDIPEDFIERMYAYLHKHNNLAKVGLSLYLDDIPDYYKRKTEVIDWEKQFWQRRIDEKLFFASVDTTFAIYRPDVPPSYVNWWITGRMDAPYSARHLGWYLDSENPSEEDLWYTKSVIANSTAWFSKDYFKKTNVR